MIDDLCSDRTIIYTICGNTQIGWGKERKQAKGIVRALVNFFIVEKADSIELFWCNARQGAEGFYLAIGFQSLGLIDRAPRIKVY